MMGVMAVGTGGTGSHGSPLGQTVKIFHITFNGCGIQTVSGHHALVAMAPYTDLGFGPLGGIPHPNPQGCHVVITVTGGTCRDIVVSVKQGIAVGTVPERTGFCGVAFHAGVADPGAGNS